MIILEWYSIIVVSIAIIFGFISGIRDWCHDEAILPNILGILVHVPLLIYLIID